MSTPVPAGPAGGDRLLRCSPDRTLVVTVDPATGRTELRKILMRGSQADAQREVAIAARLRHLPVVRHLGAELDPVTNRPCVRMELHPGTDLDQLIAERGALPAADACAMLAEVAAALAQMHGLADGGLMHGDLKPGNLLWDGERVLLLDLEHAGPRAGGALRGSFTGGTRGFAPPEAEGGAPPGPAFDVFALGATLHWLVTGGTLRRRALVGQDADLVALLAACTATDPAARPTAAALAERLRRLADRLAADPWQAALQALHAGELDAAARILAGEAPANARGLELLQLLQQRRALLASKAVALASELPPAADMPALRAELRRAQAVLLRLPRHAAALRRRADLKLAAAAAVAAAPERTGALVREAGFAAALAHVHAVLALLHSALALPGPLPIPGDGDARMPSALQRQPLPTLKALVQAITSQGEQQQALVAEFERAVAELDLAAAEAIVERIAVHLGGTAIAVSQHRDLLHRLGFYLQRIGRGRGTVERLGELQPDAQLQPLLTFLGECDQRAARGGETPTPMGLRHLQFALANLAEEFPSLRPRTEPCTALLTAALQQLTDEAWSVVAEAQAKLAAVPVPVRPLQTLLHRLDACRMLEALVDRPQRPRTQLMDRVESLRLKLEQARATRDRLASGAELAIARGHWTTGLFDMERAVTSLADVEDDDASGATERRLRERLAEARRRKQELEAATRRNVALAARYAELQDDAGSSFAERLHVLRERRDCLQFLSLHLAAERNELYGRDLRDVESQIAHERAGQAEAELDATEDAHERLRLVQRTLVMLGESAVGSASGETSGRVLRLLEHWRSLVGNAQREIDRRRELALIRQRSRRRRVATAVLAAMLLVAFALWQWGPLGRPAGAADRFFALLQRASPVQQIAADPVSAVLALRELAHALPAVQHEAADALVDEVRRMLEPRADLVPLQWHAGLLQQLQAASAAGAATAQWQAFVLQAWRTGTVLAALHCGDASEWDRLLARLDPAAGQPAGSAAPALPAAFAIELQQLRH